MVSGCISHISDVCDIKLRGSIDVGCEWMGRTQQRVRTRADVSDFDVADLLTDIISRQIQIIASACKRVR